MEKESDGQPSEIVLPIAEKCNDESTMANFPHTEEEGVSEPRNITSPETVKMNGESTIEDSKSDDQDSSDCDALVIDESVHTKKVASKNKQLTSDSKVEDKESVEITHSNPYFNESLFELSQLHQNNRTDEVKNNTEKSDVRVQNKNELKVNNSVMCKPHRKLPEKKGNPQLREYAQYLGLQPTVQFKCSKCGQSGFSSLTTLNEHHVQCTAQAPTSLNTVNAPTTPSTNFRVTRKVFLCSACGTYYENWNLFLHMREVHKRFICLYCLGMFSHPEKLSQHLMVKHNCVPGHRNTPQDFFELYKEPCFLMCCDCERVFGEQDNFFNHHCATVKKVVNNHKHSNKVSKQVKVNKGHVEHVTGDMPNTSNEDVQSIPTEVFESEVENDAVDIKPENPPEVCSNQEESEKPQETSEEKNSTLEDHILSTEVTDNQSQSQNIVETEENSNCESNLDTQNEANDSNPQVSDAIPTETNVSEPAIEESETSTLVENNTEIPPTEEPENIEENSDSKPEIEVDTRKVPKVTLKLPKPNLYSESVHEESDDSGKLTMEVDQADSEAEMAEEALSEKTQPANTEPQLQIAGPDINIVELELEQPLDKFDIKELLRKCLKATAATCIYCNHARKISVNGKQLGLHAIAEHRFSAVVNSITAEELIPESFVTRIKEGLPELESTYFNLEASSSEEAVTFSHIFECFQCRFSTAIHKELYLHNRKSHAKTILLCIMCKSNFYSYSELICHLCPGFYTPGSEVHFHCCLCVCENLPSAFRLMVHLRKRHNVCDVCLEMCHNQSRLSNHVWKHKLHHLCYRCGIAYRNKPDITKHLFWKHGTESVLCKKCLQKKWPHVYHFCIPPSSFTCEECNLSFTRAVSLKVHKRLHVDEKPHHCTIDDCKESFISKKLLLKHEFKHREPQEESQIEEVTSAKEDAKDSEMEEPEKKTEDPENENKDTEENVVEKPKPKVDVYDLPALNLSESDSSDTEDEAEKTKNNAENQVSENVTEEAEKNEMQVDPEDKPKDSENNITSEIEESTEKAIPVIENVWDDFKNYQANKGKLDTILPDNEKPSEEPVEKEEEEKIDIVDVIMKEHDYYTEESENVNVTDETTANQNTEVAHSIDHDYCSPTSVPVQSPQKTEEPKPEPTDTSVKSPKKKQNSSSSDSSSDSDSSSCTCGSNCSCSSSSGSSSSSSDSSDSDSSTPEGRRKQQARRERRRERAKNKTKDKENETVDVTATSDKPAQVVVPLETPIQESDLETTESETDEDFYDEQPQKLANKILAEKRSQLLAEIGPVANGNIVENSRPSTPSLPEEAKPKKKSKSKKRKKKKSAKYDNNIHAPNIPLPNYDYSHSPTVAPLTLTITRDSPVIPSEPPTPSTIYSHAEQMLRNTAEMDANLRASKRRRVPNKFYGYSSEEDQEKQQPKWRKSEHPSPARHVPTPPLLVPPITIKTIAPPQQPPIEPISIRTTSQPGEMRVQPIRPPLRISQPIPEHDSGTESNDSSSDEGPATLIPTRPNPPALYCYCRCPYDEVSEMIGCDSSDCAIEWFHFECVGIMVPPKGQWFCPDCRKKKQQRREMLHI